MHANARKLVHRPESVSLWKYFRDEMNAGGIGDPDNLSY